MNKYSVALMFSLSVCGAAFAAALPWNSSQTYDAPDTVSYYGKDYTALRFVYENTPPTDNWFWKDLSYVDPNNPQTWVNNITYEQGSFVTYNGKKYEAVRFVYLNTPPTDSWFWKEVGTTVIDSVKTPAGDWKNDCTVLSLTPRCSRDLIMKTTQPTIATLSYETTLPASEIASVEWYSSVQGLLGRGNNLSISSATLNLGMHEVYAIAYNRNGDRFVSEKINVPVQNAIGQAIIVAGTAFDEKSYFTGNIAPNANIAVRRLLDRGFTKEQIYYMNPVSWQAIDSDPLKDSKIVDVTTVTKSNFHARLQTIAADIKKDVPLVIYLLGHGSAAKQNGKFYFNDTSYIEPATLNTWLGEFGDLTGNKSRITVILDFGYSGLFQAGLRSTTQNRTVITSSDAAHTAYFARGKSFGTAIFNEVYRGKSLKSCFETAQLWSDNNAPGGAKANPTLNANGNGIVNEPEDFSIADSIFIGGSQQLQ